MTHKTFGPSRISRIAMQAIFLLLLCWTMAMAQDQPASPPPPAAAPQQSAISQSGLLPMFAVDLQMDPGWVDGATFPSASAKYGNNGVSDTLQQTWDLLKQGGFNIVRFSLNPGDAQSATRLANLCVWAKANSVLLVPVLNLEGSKAPADASAALVKALVSRLRGGDGQQFSAYSQISYYQIGDRLNHSGLHRGQGAQQLQQQALAAAEALRKAEVEALNGSNLQATPIMMSTSLDYELIRQGAISGVPLDADAQSKAIAELSQFITPLAASSSVDAINVEWLPRSLSAGDVDGFAGLLQAMKAAAPGKQLALTTGFSSAFHTDDEQRQFLVLTTTNLADFRASDGADTTFVGVVFRNGLMGNAAARNPEPKVSQWQWPQRARELQDFWSQGKGSADIKWWLAKNEAGLGLVQLTAGAAPTPLAGLQAFQQISSSAQQAAQSAPPAADANQGASSSPPGVPPDASATGVPPVGNSFAGGNSFVPPPGTPGAPPDGSQMMAPPAGPSAAQQSIFGVLSQFTNQLTTSLANRLQAGGGGSSAFAPPGQSNFAPDSSSFVPPSMPPPPPADPNAGFVPPPGSNTGTGSPAAPDPNTGTSNPAGGNTNPTGGTITTGGNTNPTGGTTTTDGNGNPTGGTTTTGGGNTPQGSSMPVPKILYFGVIKDAAPRPDNPTPPVVLQLTNPNSRITSAMQAELRMDGNVVATRQLGPMLPKQSRSLLFARFTAPPGSHNLQINLNGAEGTADTASATLNVATPAATGSNGNPTDSTTGAGAGTSTAGGVGGANFTGRAGGANVGIFTGGVGSTTAPTGGVVRPTLPGIGLGLGVRPGIATATTPGSGSVSPTAGVVTPRRANTPPGTAVGPAPPGVRPALAAPAAGGSSVPAVISGKPAVRGLPATAAPGSGITPAGITAPITKPAGMSPAATTGNAPNTAAPVRPGPAGITAPITKPGTTLPAATAGAPLTTPGVRPGPAGIVAPITKPGTPLPANAAAATVAPVRPGPTGLAGPVLTPARPGTTPVGMAGPVLTPVRPGPTSPVNTTGAVPLRPGPPVATTAGTPKAGSTAPTNATSSAPPPRPGPAPPPTPVRPGPGAPPANNSKPPQLAAKPPASTNNTNCAPAGTQNKNLPPCKPGQTANCAKPPCK